jgi:hypothetical protein
MLSVSPSSCFIIVTQSSVSLLSSPSLSSHIPHFISFFVANKRTL